MFECICVLISRTNLRLNLYLRTYLRAQSGFFGSFAASCVSILASIFRVNLRLLLCMGGSFWSFRGSFWVHFSRECAFACSLAVFGSIIRVNPFISAGPNISRQMVICSGARTVVQI